MMAIGRRRQLLLAGARIRGAGISPWPSQGSQQLFHRPTPPLKDVTNIERWDIWARRILRGRGRFQ
jgi:hypothetical protein